MPFTIVSSRTESSSILMGSFSISASFLALLKLKDKDPLLNIDKVSFADLVEVSPSFLVVNPV